jgi:hypothetical protein
MLSELPLLLYIFFVLECVEGIILTRGIHGSPDLDDTSVPPKNEGA